MNNKYNKLRFKKNELKNFVSIVIPVYKDLKGIKDTLNSLTTQSLNKDKFEIIVANDGGDKKIAKICKKSKVKSVNLIPRRGSYAARNKALSVTKGEYIAFIDADIKASPDWLKRGLELLKKYDYIGGKIAIDKNNLKKLSHYFDYISAFDSENKLKKYHYAPTANLFLKRKVISKLGCFDERLYSGGDFELGIRIYESKKFKMHYAEDLCVIHQARDKKALIKKYLRTTKGYEDLTKFYPKKFSYLKINFLKSIKPLVYPVFRVIGSKKEISLILRIKLFFWSIYFGFVNFINSRRIIKN